MLKYCLLTYYLSGFNSFVTDGGADCDGCLEYVKGWFWGNWQKDRKLGEIFALAAHGIVLKRVKVVALRLHYLTNEGLLIILRTESKKAKFDLSLMQFT